MSRINVEDSLANDPRFQSVVVKIGLKLAYGEWVLISKLAQRYWKEGKQLIPKKIYLLGEYDESFVKSDLVQEKEEGYYLSGSDENFAWIFAKVENGKKGGRPPENNNLTKATDNLQKSYEKPTDNLQESYSNPPTPTPTPTKNKNNICSNFDIDFLYKQYPRKIGKKKGIEFLGRNIKNQNDYDLILKAIENYAKYHDINKTEVKFIKHFSSFLNCYDDWIEIDQKELEINKTNTNKISKPEIANIILTAMGSHDSNALTLTLREKVKPYDWILEKMTLGDFQRFSTDEMRQRIYKILREDH